MKRLVASVFAICSLFLVSCLETTQEINLNEDGSGTIINTNDMSSLIGLAKQLGGAAEIEKSAMAVMDSSISMKEENLTAEEREIAKTGTMRIKANMKEEKIPGLYNFSL